MSETTAVPEASAPNGNGNGNVNGNGNGNGRRRRALLLLSAAFALIGIGVLAWWLVVARYRTTTDNAYVAGNIVQITPRVTGTVVTVKAQETDLVRQGQALVQLDDTDERIALQSAEAGLAEAVRSVRGLYANTGTSQAVIAQRAADVERMRHTAVQAEAQWQHARDELARREALYHRNFISADALQTYRTNLQASAAARAAAHSAVAEAESALVQAREARRAADVWVDHTSVEQHPQVQAAAAKLRQAYMDLRRTTIAAPEDGYVAQRRVQVGERVSPGTDLMAVVPATRLWVDANFKETELADVRIGQPVKLTSDMWGGGVIYHGKVVGLAAGTGAAFAVLPPQNASGNWIKIVQRVPVRVSLEADELRAHPLRVGLSMRVDIDTHDRGGAVLAATPQTEQSSPTSIYDVQSRDADALIARVIAANRGTGARG